ncbi:MAG: lamin tail domain-containing protein [Christensenellaceae bacterium]|nr:lamin tail domain-containing protein [Christensenellaceae bacterium]
MKRLLMLLLSLMTLGACVPARAAETMTLFAVNVGKADALLLSCGETAYLIDTGSAESWGELSRALRMLGVERLDGVIVTHTDKDHIGGAPMLAASGIEVGAWYASRYFADVKEKEHPVLLAAKSRGQAVVWLSDGDSLPLGGGTLTVLAPAAYSKEENDNSLVLLAEGAGGRMLLMGDAELAGERALMGHHPDLPKCQVLKVGHHGGADATSKALLSQVKPQIAVISTNSEVRPDTPAQTVLWNLAKKGIQVGVTQDCGAGVLVTLENGVASMELTDWAALPEPAAGIRLRDKDARADTVTLVNEGSQPVDLSGWYLRSERGGEVFVFPAGTTLAPGDALTLGTLTTETATDLLWREKNVWHNKKDDAALLFDAYGRAMDTLD